MDEPLDETGIRQARALAEHWDAPLDLILSSDLQRCCSTAEPLAKKQSLVVTIDRALRERSFGELEGRDFAHVRGTMESHALEQGVTFEHARPTGGESNHDVWERLAPIEEFLRTTSHKGVAIFTHGGTCATLTARLIKGTLESVRSFRYGNTAVTEFNRLPNGLFHMIRYAETPHLTAPSSPMIDAQAPIPS